MGSCTCMHKYAPIDACTRHPPKGGHRHTWHTASGAHKHKYMQAQVCTYIAGGYNPYLNTQGERTLVLGSYRGTKTYGEGHTPKANYTSLGTHTHPASQSFLVILSTYIMLCICKTLYKHEPLNQYLVRISKDTEKAKPAV